MLTLLDSLFLLALHEEKCRVLPGFAKRLKIGLSGAILAELVLRDKVQANSVRKLKVVDAAPVGEDTLDEALNLLQSEEHVRKASFWVKHLYQAAENYSQKGIERLAAAGVLHQMEDGLVWVVPYASSENLRASAKYVVKSRLRDLALTHGEADLREVCLLGLAKSSRLLSIIFTKDERKAAQHWIYAAMMNKAMSDPAAQVLQEIEMGVEALAAHS